MLRTSEPPSAAPIVTETGEFPNQPPHVPALQWMLELGAVPSAVTVKSVGSESRPAPFVTCTCWPAPGSVGVGVHEYACEAPEPEPLKSAIDGKLVEATSDSGSLEP